MVQILKLRTSHKSKIIYELWSRVSDGPKFTMKEDVEIRDVLSDKG